MVCTVTNSTNQAHALDPYSRPAADRLFRMRYFLILSALVCWGCDAVTTPDTELPPAEEVTLRIQSTADSMQVSYTTDPGRIITHTNPSTFNHSYSSHPDSLILLSSLFHCASQSTPCNARMEILIDDEVVRSKDLRDFIDGEDTAGNAILNVRQQHMGIYYNYPGETYGVSYRIVVAEGDYYGTTSVQNGQGALQQLTYDAPRDQVHLAEWSFSVEPGFEALLIEHQNGRRGGTGPYFACSEGGIYTVLGDVTVPMYAARVCGNGPQIFTIQGLIEE